MTDLLIHDAVVLPVDGQRRVFERGTVAVEGSRIREVGPTREGDATADADRVIDGSGSLVMPGLVNTHAHLELTALAGAWSDRRLRDLLTESTALFEQLAEGEYPYLTAAGYEQAALLFLLGGVTTTNSMDLHPARGAPVFGEAGLRGTFGAALTDLFLDVPVDEQFDRARAFLDEYHGSYDGRIRGAVCPHDDWSCSRSLWERTARLAAEYPDVPVHTHVLELDASDRMARRNGAADSLALLEEVGLLDERLVAAHFRVADDRDVARIADAGASVAHCPSVFCYWNPDPEDPWTPVRDLLDADATVGLGLDDHYWHDSANLFGEARQARLAANLSDGANQFSSMELLRMLTIEGARALGLGEEIGSLEPGKRADLLVLDVDAPKFAPLTNAPARVVNSAAPADVRTVLVDGDVVLDGGEPVTMDAEAVTARVRDAVERFCEESEWELHLGGGESPSAVETARDLPKRGPAQLLGRLAVQSVRDVFED